MFHVHETLLWICITVFLTCVHFLRLCWSVSYTLYSLGQYLVQYGMIYLCAVQCSVSVIQWTQEIRGDTLTVFNKTGQLGSIVGLLWNLWRLRSEPLKQQRCSPTNKLDIMCWLLMGRKHIPDLNQLTWRDTTSALSANTAPLRHLLRQ